ncbi:hypothetical protein LC605_25140 [Nostoc sp. CHAB 5836]|uniref:hypothetical protein n=1 Tax=Nostoc sp. CHAB 5836 TaxID=2780404 RepID=UPI001E2F59F4|nr:hypothetical protein [Nostoc sp. CHAB 5836]MCC5618309.1 hypothetical protein [Nostoc sp. CHAB 5836]
MPNTVDSNFDRRANHLLRLIQLCGGCVPLHSLQFQVSNSVIQTLLDRDFFNPYHIVFVKLNFRSVKSGAEIELAYLISNTF